MTECQQKGLLIQRAKVGKNPKHVGQRAFSIRVGKHCFK